MEAVKKYVPIFHPLLFVLIYLLLYAIGEFKVLPNNDNLLNWDTSMYFSIKEKGYFFNPPTDLNTGFFPFFPLVWKISGLSAKGIILLNYVFFLLGFFTYFRKENLSVAKLCLYFSFPSLIFFAVPYTEALFFFFSAILLVGLDRKDYRLIGIGLFVSSLIRPTIVFFFPAIVFVEVMALLNKKQKALKTILHIIAYSSIAVLGIFLVNAYQFQQTGEWNTYYYHQTTLFKHYFQWPAFPLETWRGSWLMWLDGLAFAVALSAGILGLRYFFRPKWAINIPSSVLFSLAYLGMVIVYLLFFHSKGASGNTSILSANRYVFATIFFPVVFFYYFPLNLTIKTHGLYFSLYLLILLAVLGSFAPFNFPNHLRTVIYFLMISGLLWASKWKYYQWIWIGIVVLHFGLQLICYHNFLQNVWVG